MTLIQFMASAGGRGFFARIDRAMHMKKSTVAREVDHIFADRNLIAKRNDVRISRVRRLQQRQFRDQERVFLCEGARFLFKAYETGAHIQSCIYSPALVAGRSAQKLLCQIERRGVPMIRVSKEVFISISSAEEPSGLMTICAQRIQKLRRVCVRGDAPIWLALDSVRSPGNLGTIMRTCDGVGAAGIIFIDAQTDPYHPAAVRGSMGSIFSVPLVRASAEEFTNWAKRMHYPIVGTAPQAKLNYSDTTCAAPLIVLMGSERKGLNAKLQNCCDLTLSIPMVGRLDSLNLAVAAGIILYDVFQKTQQKQSSAEVQAQTPL